MLVAISPTAATALKCENLQQWAPAALLVMMLVAISPTAARALECENLQHCAAVGAAMLIIINARAG